MKVKEKKTGSKKTLWITLACFAAAVVFIAGVVLLSSAERKSVLTKTLERFYTALYIDSDWDTFAGCIAEGRREAFELAMTSGGITPILYLDYPREAAAEYGEGFSVSVRINEIMDYHASVLVALQDTFPNTTKAVRVTYDIIFTPVEGEEGVYSNDMIMVQVGGRWYMTTHLLLPIGSNAYVE